MPTIHVQLGFAAALLLVGALGLALQAVAAEPPDKAAAPADAQRAQEVRRILYEPGLAVCRESVDGSRQFRGFTLSHEQGRVQIQVTQINALPDNTPVTGFRETKVWDAPENWRVCPA